MFDDTLKDFVFASRPEDRTELIYCESMFSVLGVWSLLLFHDERHTKSGDSGKKFYLRDRAVFDPESQGVPM